MKKARSIPEEPVQSKWPEPDKKSSAKPAWAKGPAKKVESKPKQAQSWSKTAQNPPQMMEEKPTKPISAVRNPMIKPEPAKHSYMKRSRSPTPDSQPQMKKSLSWKKVADQGKVDHPGITDPDLKKYSAITENLDSNQYNML